MDGMQMSSGHPIDIQQMSNILKQLFRFSDQPFFIQFNRFCNSITPVKEYDLKTQQSQLKNDQRKFKEPSLTTSCKTLLSLIIRYIKYYHIPCAILSP